MDRIAEGLDTSVGSIVLWIGIALVALALLGRAAVRRRETLTAVLKKHVEKTTGIPPERTSSNEDVKN